MNVPKWLKAALILALLAFLAHRGVFDRLVELLDRRLLLALAAAQPFLIAGIALIGWRLKILLGPGVGFWASTKAVALTGGLALALPAHLSEFVKPVYIREHAGVPASTTLAAVVLERAEDVILLGILVLISLGLHLSGGWQNVPIVLAVLLIAGILSLPALESRLRRVIERLPGTFVRKFAGEFLGHAVESIRRGRLVRAYLVGIVAWVVSFGSIAAFVATVAGERAGWSEMLAIFVLTMIGVAIQALPAGFGTYEAAAALGLKPLGYELEQGLAIGFVMHAAVLFPQVIVAALILVFERTGLGALIAELKLIRSSTRKDG